MPTTSITKLRCILQHAEIINNLGRLLDRAAGLLTAGQVSNRPDIPEILPQELVDIVGVEQTKKILAARTAFHTPEILDPKPDPEPQIVYVTVPAEPVAPVEPVAEPAAEPVAEPAAETVAEPAAEPVAEPVDESAAPAEPVTEPAA